MSAAAPPVTAPAPRRQVDHLVVLAPTLASGMQVQAGAADLRATLQTARGLVPLVQLSPSPAWSPRWAAPCSAY